MQVYLVHAEHFHIPGVVLQVFATKDGALAEAVKLANMLLKDCAWPEIATPDNYEKQVERVQDERGAQHCFVEISKLEVQP